MGYVPNTMVHCPNCGTDYTPQLRDQEAATTICPVCHYIVASAASEGIGPTAFERELISDEASIGDDFERRLSDFVQQASLGGMSFERISRALRDELAFVAELSDPGRRYVVQIIDLGPEEQSSRYLSPTEARQILQRPTVRG